MAGSVVVVGAGPAGAAAVQEALALELDVRWYDAGEPRGSWAESVPFPCEGLACTGYRSLWGSDEVEERDTLTNPYGPGFLVDRASHAAELVRGTGREPSRERVLERVGDFLIDASGRAGGPARKLGGGRVHLDRQVAVQVHFPSADEDARVTTETVPEGWWYSLRCPTGRTLGLVTDEAGLRKAFHELRQATRLMTWPATGEPTLRLAGLSRLERCAGPGWAAVGDAALALDPLGSRGVWLAVESGRRAARVAAGALGWEDYADWLERQFFAYLAEREALYALETRWPDAPYWRQRREGSPGGGMNAAFP